MTSNERFRALRKALGLNMQQMGDVLGISHSGISNIESGSSQRKAHPFSVSEVSSS